MTDIRPIGTEFEEIMEPNGGYPRRKIIWRVTNHIPITFREQKITIEELKLISFDDVET